MVSIDTYEKGLTYYGKYWITLRMHWSVNFQMNIFILETHKKERQIKSFIKQLTHG